MSFTIIFAVRFENCFHYSQSEPFQTYFTKVSMCVRTFGHFVKK